MHVVPESGGGCAYLATGNLLPLNHVFQGLANFGFYTGEHRGRVDRVCSAFGHGHDLAEGLRTQRSERLTGEHFIQGGHKNGHTTRSTVKEVVGRDDGCFQTSGMPEPRKIKPQDSSHEYMRASRSEASSACGRCNSKSNGKNALRGGERELMAYSSDSTLLALLHYRVQTGAFVSLRTYTYLLLLDFPLKISAQRPICKSVGTSHTKSEASKMSQEQGEHAPAWRRGP